MNISFALLLVLLTGLAVQGAQLKKDRGKDGKDFWGKNYTIYEGFNLEIPCNSKPKTGYKASGFFWKVMERHFGTKVFVKSSLISQHPRKKVYISRAYGINHSLMPNTRTMKINNITRYASGTYSCTVLTLIKPRSHYLESTFFNINVLAPARIDSKMGTKINLSAGEKLELDCTSSGNPTPGITWQRLDRPLVDTIKHNQGLLLVENVKQTDSGEYRCVSSNTYGKDQRTFHVEVAVSARVKQNTETSYGTVGQDGVVKCEAVGHPDPVFSWNWYDSQALFVLKETEKRGRFSVTTKHYFDKSISYLLIKNMRKSDFKDYFCNAKNEGSSSSMPIHFKQYAVPEIPKIRNVVSKVNQVDVSWEVGSDNGKPITAIIIEYARSDVREWINVTVKNLNINRYSIKNLEAQIQYLFRIRAVNDIGESTSSTVHYGTPRLAEGALPKTDPVKLKSSSVNIIVGGFAGGFLVLVIAIIIVCILMRNIQRNSAKKAAENAERLAKTANQDTTAALINLLQHGGERLSSAPGSGDKSVAEAIELTTSNKWEFPRDRLVLQNILGSGAFGIVMKAEADGINGINSGTLPVAVKFVKENESPSAKKDLVAELELLKLIEPHMNVINLLGCCTRSEPLMVIVEYCAYGDLQSFLRCSRGVRDPYYIDCYKRPSSRLTSKELLLFGTQIAKGMAHLACLKVIHRDLAARNILVDENKVCKVSDFGFARDIYVEDHYTRKTAGGRFPIKWMAIESLLDGISTTKSDVWSFAIVLWEIITLGASPYPGMNSQEVVSFLQNGMRMEKPKHCSDELYNLLLDCWQVAAHRRPNFEMLARYLDKMYHDNFEYINMRTYDDHLYINFDGNTISGSNSATLTKQDSASSQNSRKSEDSEQTPMI